MQHFVSAVPRSIERTLRYNAKKKCEKKERETGNCSRNPFTAFQLASRITETFPVERFHEKGKSGESAKQESKNGEGLKTGALCRRLFMCTIVDRKIKSWHTTLYLFSALSTRRVRARFPHFDGFHPKFSAGTSPFLLSLADLHNILEILYKISLLSFSLFPYYRRLNSLLLGLDGPYRDDRRRQMRNAHRS